MKVFIDTNVLIDLVCSRTNFVREAAIIFDLAYKGNYEIAICALSFINAYYVGKRYKFRTEDLRDSLESIVGFVEVTPLDHNVLGRAFSLSSGDFEDVTQYYSAKTGNVDVIVTRNKKDFKFQDIKVLTPTEFLEEYFGT